MGKKMFEKAFCDLRNATFIVNIVGSTEAGKMVLFREDYKALGWGEEDCTWEITDDEIKIKNTYNIPIVKFQINPQIFNDMKVFFGRDILNDECIFMSVKEDISEKENKISSDEIRQQLDLIKEKIYEDDLEEALEDLQKLVDIAPRDQSVALEYISLMRQLNMQQEALITLNRIVEFFPHDPMLWRMWACQPFELGDALEAVRRIQIVRNIFDLPTHPGLWDLLPIEADSLSDSNKWQKLEHLLHRYEINDFSRHVLGVFALLRIANLYFSSTLLRQIVHETPENVWKELPNGARETLIFRADSAERNSRLLRNNNISVISIGQNCLPYQLLGRWGYMSTRGAAPGARTPFDLGGYQNEKSAEPIMNDFADYIDSENFTFPLHGKFVRWPNNIKNAVSFFHDKGKYTTSEEKKNFMDFMRTRVENWRKLSHSGPNIYVYSVCGACDLHKFLDIVYERLTLDGSHIVILNVLQTEVDCPNLKNVHYAHIPYPASYDWTNVADQLSARGLHFEHSIQSVVMQAVMDIIVELR